MLTSGATGSAASGLTDTELRDTPVPVTDSTAQGHLATLSSTVNGNAAARVDLQNIGGLATPIAVGNGAAGADTLRVTLANNSTGTVVASAGTNLNTSALALEATQALQMARADTFKTRGDTFTTTTNGTTIDCSASPMSAFGIQVKMTGSVTSWDVRLEGSLNGTDFSTILTHTNITGDAVVLWTGTLEAPTLYFRSRAAGLVLGGGTNIVTTILGQN